MTFRPIALATPRLLLLLSLVGLLGLPALGCKDLSLFGPKLGKRIELHGGELYYTDRVDEAAAKRLGQYLVDESYFDGTPKTVQIDKKDQTWLLRMVVKAGMDQDRGYVDLVKLFGMQVSNGVFSGESLEVELCDEKMKTLRAVSPLDGTRLELHGGVIYYASMVDEATAKKLAEHYVESGFFDGKPKTLQLLEQEGTWHVRLVVQPGIAGNAQAVRELEVMGLELSGHVFDGAKVVLHLCDDKLVTQKEVPCPDGKREVFEGGELYYASSVKPELAKKFGRYLVEDGFFDGSPKTVRLSKVGDAWRFQMVAKPGVEEDPGFMAGAKTVAKQLSERVFDGEKVELHLCDPTLHTRQVVVGE